MDLSATLCVSNTETVSARSYQRPEQRGRGQAKNECKQCQAKQERNTVRIRDERP